MKKNKNIFGFGTRTAKKARAEIRRINKKRSEEGKEILSKEEEERVIRKVTKEEKRKIKTKAIFAALGLMSATSLLEGVALLNSGNEGVKSNKNEITINTEQAEKDVNVINVGDRNVFIDGIKVDTNNLNYEKNKELKENVAKEVESLETSEDVLNYLKQFYANEYNKENDTHMTAENVRLGKTREMTTLFKDKAENGEEIIKDRLAKDKTERKIDIEAGVINAVIIQEGKIISSQEILNNNNQYKRVYSSNEDVEKYEDNLLVKTGKIIDKGIDWNVAMDQKETDPLIKKQYKQRFIDAIVEYKEEQIEKISNSSLLENNFEER